MKNKDAIVDFVEKQTGTKLDSNLGRPELEKAAIEALV